VSRAPESGTDAVVDADIPFEPGTARAALRHRDFRIFWAGTLASNVGTWMQNVILIAFGYELTHSPVWTGLLTFGQLGPLLFFAPVGGVLADVFDRRRLLIVTQFVQLVLSFVLAGLAANDHPSLGLLFTCVLAIGVANALGAPSLPSVIPSLVGSEDLNGAVSLMSAQMNISRVIGPAIGGVLYPAFGAAPVFAINALTYLFAVAAILAVRFPRRDQREGGRPSVFSGFRIVRRDPLIRRALITITTLSFCSLSFIGLMPALAAVHLHMRAKSTAFGLLYAAFGAGAAVGAIAVGTFLARRSKPRLASGGLLAFAVLLAAFATVTVRPLAYPIVIGVGLSYFTVVTSLNTLVQLHVDDAQRGRVMAVWIMGFGGTVPLGTLLAGAIADHTSVSAVILAGAVVAALLAVYTRGLATVST
jgi:MFS family permease